MIHFFVCRAVLAGGTFPGPLITGYKVCVECCSAYLAELRLGRPLSPERTGRFRLADKLSRGLNSTRQDQLTDNTMVRSTSVHWHGLFQKDTSWADGTSFVSRKPKPYITTVKLTAFSRVPHRCEPLVLVRFPIAGTGGDLLVPQPSLFVVSQYSSSRELTAFSNPIL